MIRRILVGLGDTQHADSATRAALELARMHNAELTGIAVLDISRIGATGPVPLGAGHMATELREHRLEMTREIIGQLNDQFENACKAAGVRYHIECDQPQYDPYQCFAQHARYHDLIVSGLGHLFEHGVVEEPPAEVIKLVQAGVRPLITVPTVHREIRRVLIAYSGSMASAKAMKRFVQLRIWPDVALKIVTFQRPEEEALQLLQDAGDYCRAHELDVETDYQAGPPRKNLLPYARQWEADLIVMGNSNTKMLIRRIFGETMYHVVQHADLPLFLAQ